MRWRVTAPDGTRLSVEAASQAEAIALGKRQHAQTPPPATTPPSVSETGEIVRAPSFLERVRGRIEGGGEPVMSTVIEGLQTGLRALPGNVPRLLEDLPEQMLPRTRTDIISALATLPFGGEGALVKGALQRAGAATIGAAASEVAQGRSPLPAWRYGAAQLGGEALVAPFRLRAGEVALRHAERAWNASKAHNEAMHAALTELDDANYKSALAAAKHAWNLQEQAKAANVATANAATKQRYTQAVQAAQQEYEYAYRAFSEQGASKVAEAAKQKVSAWHNYPSSPEGLLQMAESMRGRADLYATFDKALQDVIARGRGTMIPVSAEDLRVLKISAKAFTENPITRQLEALVDAGLVAERVTGKWKSAPNTYRRIVNELDRLEIGDPVARGEYRAGQAILQFIDQTNALKDLRYRPERVRAGLTVPRARNELMRRSEGDYIEGVFAPTIEGIPQLVEPPKPTLLPKLPKGVFVPPKPLAARPPLYVPPSPAAPGQSFRTRTTPPVRHPFALGATAELPFALTGHYAGGAPFALGTALGWLGGGRRFVTRAPLLPSQEALLRLGALLSGQPMRPGLPDGGPDEQPPPAPQGHVQ